MVAVLTLAAAAFAAVLSARHGFFDLRVYRGAVDYWVHDGGMLYDYVNPNTQYGFTYPTFAALTMLPMAFLPWSADDDGQRRCHRRGDRGADVAPARPDGGPARVDALVRGGGRVSPC